MPKEVRGWVTRLATSSTVTMTWPDPDLGMAFVFEEVEAQLYWIGMNGLYPAHSSGAAAASNTAAPTCPAAAASLGN